MNGASENWRNAGENKNVAASTEKGVDYEKIMREMEQRFERTMFNRLEMLKGELNQKLYYIEVKLDTLINMLGPTQQYGRGGRAGRCRGQGMGNGRYSGTGANRQILGGHNIDVAAALYSSDGMAMVDTEDGFSNELIHPALRTLFNQFSPLNDFDDRINGQRAYHQPNSQHYQTRPHHNGNRGGANSTRKLPSPAASSSSTGTQFSIGTPISSGGIRGGGKRSSAPTLDGSFGTSVRRQHPGSSHHWNGVGAIFLNAVAGVAGCSNIANKNINKPAGNGTLKVSPKETLGTNSGGTKQDGKPRKWTTHSMLGSYTDSDEGSSNDDSDVEQSDSGKSDNGTEMAKKTKEEPDDVNGNEQELVKSEEMKLKELKLEDAAPLKRRCSI